MAEALGTVSVVASIVQLVDFTTRVVRRLEEFRSNAGEVPASFRHINTKLPLLEATLLQINEAINANSVADGTEKALLSVVKDCETQIAALDELLARTLPEINDSWRKRGKKVILSLYQDDKVEAISKSLQNYIGVLTFYYTVASSISSPTGKFFVS